MNASSLTPATAASTASATTSASPLTTATSPAAAKSITSGFPAGHEDHGSIATPPSAAMLRLFLLRSLIGHELRLRTRRISTLVAMLGLMALGWHMVVDVSTGHASMVVNSARVMYTSSMLSMATALQASPLFALIGFYLIRGRIAEDLRSGIGSVIAASPVGNGWFLLGRWLGGVAYLLMLALSLLLTMLLCQGLRGDGPVELGVYVQTYLVILLPIICFAVSFAILFDCIAPLMGKAGDVVYFFIWISQLSLLPVLMKMQGSDVPPVFMLDFTGMLMAVANFKAHLHTDNLSLGYNAFNPALAPIVLPNGMWSGKMMLMRSVTMVLAWLPLLPAGWLFHRFSPDRVKPGHARTRRSPLAMLNDWLRPLARLVQPVFAVAARIPGLPGKVVADIALTLSSSPSAILALLLACIASTVASTKALPGLLVPILGFWGVLISSLSTRDFDAALEEMTAAVPGGSTGRHLRQLLASTLLGILFASIILLRLSVAEPLHALALLTGIVLVAGCASLLGRATRTARTFVSVFLVWIYVALNTPKSTLVDLLDFNHTATPEAIAWHALLAAGVILAGFVVNAWRGK